MLEDISKNIERLIALYESQKMENISLLAELDRIKSENEAYRRQVEELEHKIDNLKLTEAFMMGPGGEGASSKGGQGAKEKIEKLIKEIDKCLMWLKS